MSALVINDTSYAGEAASYMLTKNVIDFDTLNKGCIMVQDGIKKKFTLPRLDVLNVIQRRNETPVSSGSITVDGRALVVEDMMLYLEFNPRDYEQHWFATQLNPRLLDTQLPQTAEAFMMDMIMKRAGEFMENAVWRGRKDYDLLGSAVNPVTKGAEATDANYFYFDGLIKKALDASDIITVPSPVVLTGGASGNIADEFQRAYLKVPKALLYKYGSKGVKFFVSYPDQQKYESVMQLKTVYKNQDTTERGINRYNGYEVIPIAGMPENTFFVGVGHYDIGDRSSNLWFGLNSVDDSLLELKKVSNPSELYYVKGLWKADVQIAFPDQLVAYTQLIA